MSTITIQDSKFISLRQAATLALHNRNIRVFMQGEPGIGKTSQTGWLQDQTGYDATIINVPEMDIGDVAFPVIDHETRTTKYYPNARFLLQHGKPVIITLDEYSKGDDPIKKMLHPTLDIFRPRLGDIPIPEGSIILLTGNLGTDGVGDSMDAHTLSRLCRVNVRKSDAEESIIYGSDNNFHPLCIAWAHRHPQAFASYITGDQDSNEFIFNPSKVQDSYFCPRAWENISRILYKRENYDTETLRAGIAGLAGESTANSFMGFIRHQDALPPWATIMADPRGTEVPTDPGAIAVLVYGALEYIKDTVSLEAFLNYIERIDLEWQSVFCIALARSTKKQHIGFSSKRFAAWVVENEDLL